MDYDWLPNRDKRLGSPADQFFDKPVIQGDDLEIPGLYSQSTSPISWYVDFLLRNRDKIDNFGELLAPLNVRYVILVHEIDYGNYDFLYKQKDMSVVLERDNLTLFKNEHSTSRVYGVDSVVYIQSLEEYLGLSQTQDVMEHLYILGEGSSAGKEAQTQRLNYMEKSPINYQVEGTSKTYTIFVVPQNVSIEYWQYDGKKSLKNLGFMPAFASSVDGSEVVYTRFYHVYLPSYITSLVALGLMVWYYLSHATRGKGSQK